jgi:hypothetical protein
VIAFNITEQDQTNGAKIVTQKYCRLDEPTEGKTTDAASMTIDHD